MFVAVIHSEGIPHGNCVVHETREEAIKKGSQRLERMARLYPREQFKLYIGRLTASIEAKVHYVETEL